MLLPENQVVSQNCHRYDKLDASYLAFVYLAAIAILLFYDKTPDFSNKV